MTSQHSVQQLSLMLTCFNKARRRCLGDTGKYVKFELDRHVKKTSKRPSLNVRMVHDHHTQLLPRDEHNCVKSAELLVGPPVGSLLTWVG